MLLTLFCAVFTNKPYLERIERYFSETIVSGKDSSVTK